ncbi:Ca-activated chloride channel family protein [Gracilibacillus ureilyticus]|uniref:Ca-activated chloride channel family protein n=1 Tax=Gracilibacillus ureilyticus TaxID=531814 RepID=A0A1H9VID7_9BACI|nr:VWA domain-containing protein [Gracilibacillus ureilyticus]SES21546.1 Ca-activated chloride channel family protein [Gracilibacillus ureilyticus]
MRFITLSLLLSFSVLVLASCVEGDRDSESNEETSENRDNTLSEESDETINSEESNENSNKSNTTLLEKAPELPTNLQDVADYPAGPLAGNGRIRGEAPLMPIPEMADYVMEQLPPISEEASEEELDQWFKAYRSLFAEDYPDPDELITEIQVDQSDLPKMGDKQISFKDQFNVLVILDVSKSMVNEINGEPMMDIAKRSIEDFVGQLPEEANVGLRVYGHEGENTAEMRAQSCQSSELVYPLQPLDQSAFGDVLDSFQPTGWTPIALSLKQAKQDFEDYPSETNNNLVYVVSDGAETCDGDPVEVAKELVDSNIEPIINVIGFNMDEEDEQELQKLAEAGEGVYTSVGDEEELKRVFEEAKELLLEWKKWKSSAEVGASGDMRDVRSNVLDLRGEWRYLASDERNIMQKVLMQLSDGDFLGGNYSYLFDSVNTLWSDIEDYGDEAQGYLEEKLENKYEEAINDINDQYNDNVVN